MAKVCKLAVDKVAKEAFKKVSSVVSSTASGGDNLIHIKVTGKDGQGAMRVYAYNGACESNLKLPVTGIEEDWKVGVPLKHLGRIFAEGEYNFELYDSRLVVRTSQTKYILPIVDNVDSPFDGLKFKLDLEPTLHKKLLGFLAASLAKDGISGPFEFCRVFSDGGLMKAWAADNRSFVQRTIGPTDQEFSFLVHRSMMLLMSGLETGKLRLTEKQNAILYYNDISAIKILAGAPDYPDLSLLRKRFDQSDSKMVVDARTFVLALRSALAISANADSQLADFTIRDGKVVIECSADEGKSIAEVPVEGECPDKKFSVNASILSHMISGMGEKLTFAMGRPGAPVFIYQNSTDDFMMLMPVYKEGAKS